MLVSPALAFLWSISCFQRQDSCMGESLISTSMVALGQLNQRHTALGIELDVLGFRNLLFYMNSGRKKELGRGKKKNKLFFFLKNLKEKRCKKSFVLNSEPFHKMRKLFGTFLLVLPRSWKGYSEMWENSVRVQGKKGGSIWKESKTISQAGLNWHLHEWYLFAWDFWEKHEIPLPIPSEKTWLQMHGAYAFPPPKK